MLLQAAGLPSSLEAEQHPIARIRRVLFMHPSVDRHSSCISVLATGSTLEDKPCRMVLPGYLLLSLSMATSKDGLIYSGIQ